MPQHFGQAGFFQQQQGITAMPRPFGNDDVPRPEPEKSLGGAIDHRGMGIDVNGAGIGLHQVGLQ